ncbi:MAG TPA: energy transducer TonB [Phenylobacterium sp.]|nr:energy transducer TonB [Phenylobacterium sp.]
MGQRSDLRPALAGSALLHAAVVLAALISWPFLGKPVKMGEVVPVNIVSNAEASNLRPAVQADEPAPAATEDPLATAPPEMAAPSLEPDPAPPTPQPAPKAERAPPPPKTVTPAQKTPTPKPATKQAPTAATKPSRPTPAPGLDLDALAASIAKTTRPSGQRVSSAAKGASRPETAAQTRPGAGARTGEAAAALNALADELGRRWNPNCNVEGGDAVRLSARFHLAAGGAVRGDPQIIRGMSSDPVVQAAAIRAIGAIKAASPFEDLPPDLYGQDIIVNFDARKVCAG